MKYMVYLTSPTLRDTISLRPFDRMQSTRQDILSHLQRHPAASVGDLATRLGMSLGTIRHHLSVLERAGLVSHEVLRQEIGRPRMVYSLSERGEESFPKQYDRLSAALLTEIKAQHGDEALMALIRGAARRLTESMGINDLPADAYEARLQSLLKLMDRDGNSLEWKLENGRLQIHQHTCPYQAVAGQHPEVCQFDRELIGCVMGKPVRQIASRIQGDSHCAYEIDLDRSKQG